MLFLLLKFLYIIILSFLYGHNIQRFLNFLLVKEKGQPSFPLTVLIGIFCISIFGAILSIFMPLGTGAHLLIAAGGLLNFLLHPKAILQYKVPLKTFSIITIIYVLYLSSQASFTYDEGLYYAQFIKWMQYYPTVPGLANLHVRFGFNSHWHVVAAIFNQSWLPGNHLNGVLFLMTVLYLIPGKDDAPFIRALKAGVLVLVNMPQVCVYNIIAPAADLAVFYISCLLVVVWLENRSKDLLSGTGAVFLLFAPLFLVTVKVSSLPVLLLTAFILWQSLQKKHIDRIFVIFSLGIVIIFPWIIRNVILSGYPLFPMELPDLFHTGWGVPKAVIQSTRQDITAFAFYRSADIARLTTDSFAQRFITWFGQHVRIYDKLLIIIAFISPIIVFIRRKHLPSNFLSLYIFLILGCSFWLIQAPDPRFAYGYLVPLFIISVLLVIPVLQYIGDVVKVAFVAAVLFQAGTIVLHYKLHKTFIAEGMIKATDHQPWITPVPYTQQPVTEHTTPFPMYIPINTELCWDTPLPCADHMPKNVVMRGGTLADGFKSLE